MSWIDILKGGNVLVLSQNYEEEADDPYYAFSGQSVIGLFSSESKILEWLEKERFIEPTQEQDIESILDALDMRFDSYTIDRPPERLQ